MTKEYECLRPIKNPESYSKFSTFMGAVATHYAGVTIDAHTIHRWGDMMALCREVDDHIDEYDATPDEVRERLETFTSYTNDYETLAPTEENVAARERLFSTTDRIILLGQEIASAKSLETYIKYRREEALATRDLFNDSATDYVRQQENFTERFLPAVGNLVVSANMLDSATDLPNDYERGHTLLQPTLRNRFALLVESFSYGKRVLPIFKHSAIRSETKRTAIGYLQRRTHRGATPRGSSLG